MSIVLEALEKAQREGKVVSLANKERVPQEDRGPQLEIRTLHRPRPRRKFLIFGSILFIAIINLVFLGWWLNRNNSSVSVDIPTISKVPLPKIIPSNPPRRTLPVNVTGVVWDQKQPIALVNGKFLKEGDEILGAKVMDIKLHEVVFLYKDKEFTVSVE